MESQRCSSRSGEGPDETDGEANPGVESGVAPALAPDVLFPLWSEWNSAESAELEARRLFQRTLGAWAMDVLSLRRRGLDCPGLFRRSMGLVTRGRAA